MPDSTALGLRRKNGLCLALHRPDPYGFGVLAFIDESGDPGLKLAEGSSPLFVVAMALFADADTARACDQAIDSLRLRLGLPARFEFRFARNRNHIRRRFLQTVAEHAFHYFVSYVDKSLLGPRNLRNKNELYRWTVASAVDLAGADLSNATLVVDRAGDRTFRNELATHLRRNVVRSENLPVRKLKMDASDQNNLLQLADYLAGVSARAYLGETAAGDLRSIVAGHEANSELWQDRKKTSS
jgi:hypothetical protein